MNISTVDMNAFTTRLIQGPVFTTLRLFITSRTENFHVDAFVRSFGLAICCWSIGYARPIGVIVAVATASWTWLSSATVKVLVVTGATVAVGVLARMPPATLPANFRVRSTVIRIGTFRFRRRLDSSLTAIRMFRPIRIATVNTIGTAAAAARRNLAPQIKLGIRINPKLTQCVPILRGFRIGKRRCRLSDNTERIPPTPKSGACLLRLRIALASSRQRRPCAKGRRPTPCGGPPCGGGGAIAALCNEPRRWTPGGPAIA